MLTQKTLQIVEFFWQIETMMPIRGAIFWSWYRSSFVHLGSSPGKRLFTLSVQRRLFLSAALFCPFCPWPTELWNCRSTMNYRLMWFIIDLWWNGEVKNRFKQISVTSGWDASFLACGVSIWGHAVPQLQAGEPISQDKFTSKTWPL